MMGAVRLPDGTEVPALGQGTWHMGESASVAKAEVAALKLGIELGFARDVCGVIGPGIVIRMVQIELALPNV